MTATIFAPIFRSAGSSRVSSSVSPLLESAMTTSSRAIRPRSPWAASAGCTKSDGVPVEASVAEIFWATKPGFPMPVTTTRPLQPRSHSTALAKGAPSWTAPMARASAAMTCCP